LWINRLSPERLAEIKALMAKGTSQREIARTLKMGRETVRKAFFRIRAELAFEAESNRLLQKHYNINKG
jgi:DNA-binding CsgD family transcriptional regulator